MDLLTILERTKELAKKTRYTNKKMTIVSISTVFLIIIILVLWWWDKINIEKLDFYIETKTPEEFTNEIEINKPGKIIGAQEILITAQAAWSIKNIFFKEWESVWENTKLIELNDSIANYSLMVERAKNGLNAARLQYQQSQNQTNQIIEWNKLNLEWANQTLNTAKFMSEQSTKLAENTIKTSNNSKNNILIQMESEIIKLEWFLKNVLHQIDWIFWVTDEYISKTYYFKDDLSANKIEYRENWESQLLELYERLKNIKSIDTSSDIENIKIKNNLSELNWTYYDIKRLLETTHNALIFSRSSSRFSQAQIDWFISMVNGLQSQYQANFSMFGTLKQTIDWTLIKEWTWYKIAWEDSSKISYQNTLISSAKQTFDAGLWLKSAELNYENSIKNEETSLGLASVNIKSAEISYKEAKSQLEKLNIKAPISWTIWKILVDKWQEIGMWTPIISIINNDEPMAEVWITTSEYSKMNSGSKVIVEYMWENISGNIVSISSQAWPNGLYNAIIKLSKKVENIWDVANIKIYNSNNNFTLPLNIVHPLEAKNAYIYVIQDNKPNILNIKIGEVWWDRIEIISEIPKDTIIITNNIWNYNPNIHNLIIK